jgi:GT2 family glycosyltransferase
MTARLTTCGQSIRAYAFSRWVATPARARANRGPTTASHEFVALINTDVVVALDWLARMARALDDHSAAASVGCKMLELDDPSVVYDAGDVLRRDGVCEQPGRFGSDTGRRDASDEVFGACAGAALYRRSALLAGGGFAERYFAYLEDADFAPGGWRCRYESAVALHAGEASSMRLPGGHHALVTRNTILLVAKAFPISWLPFVAYRQLAWAWHAALERRFRAHIRALLLAIGVLPAPRFRSRWWCPRGRSGDLARAGIGRASTELPAPR